MIMYFYREDSKKLVESIKEYDANNDTFTYARDHTALATVEPEASTSSTTTTTRRRERRPSMIAKATDLMWMSSKIDKFDAAPCWWAGSYLIAMRIMQTSVMALIPSPGLQAVAASLIALVGVSVQTHAAPYRRASDNHAALVAAWLLFAWCFVLLLRYSGAVGGEHSIVLGVLLIVLTVGMMAEVMRSLGVDVWKEIEKNKQRDDADAEAEPEAGEAHAESGVEAGASAAGGEGTSPDGGSAAPSSRAPAAPSGSSWGIFMCGAGESTADDGDAKPRTLEDAEAEIAKLRADNAAQIVKLRADNAAHLEELKRLTEENTRLLGE